MTSKQIIVAGVLFVLSFVLALVLLQPTHKVNSAAFTGQAAYLQVATTTTAWANTNKQIATSTANCNARVITTSGESGIRLIFGDTTNRGLASTTLSSTFGHLQLASTTVVYDSGLYGCGNVYVRSWADVGLTMTQF